MHQTLPINLDIPSQFFKEEVKAEYLVTEKMKKIWAVELDLLNELLRVCKKHNIEVYAFAGTLLGAVRHGGFIPWDDDVDVGMTRENFEKLVRVAKDEFKHPYFFQTAYNDKKYFFGYARLRNSQTTGIITWNKSIEYNNGLYIDIFVLDGLCDSRWRRKLQSLTLKVLNRVGNAYYAQSKAFSVLVLKNTICRVVKYEKMVNYYHRVLSKYNKIAKRVSFLTDAPEEAEKYGVLAESLTGDECLPFEGLSIPVPRNYKTILEETYGDYMQYPPIEQRGEWHNGILIQDPDKSYIDFLKEEQDKEKEIQ